MKWIVRGAAAMAVIYVTLCGAVTLAMRQSPERFGRIITYVPEPLVWGVLPGRQLWLWARGGALTVGSAAPDFTLETYDHASRVTLSSFQGQRPVVLVFGSYT